MAIMDNKYRGINMLNRDHITGLLCAIYLSAEIATINSIQEVVMHTERPRVGVGVLVFNKHGQILLGKRLSSHGAATWSPPGGHLEFGEDFAACALRELREETGLIAEDASFIGITNDIFWENNKHYISIFMRVMCPCDQLPEICEPDKIMEWQWFSLDTLPEPLFLPLENIMKQKCMQHLISRNFSVSSDEQMEYQ
jgi:8-oxo-dGTP diphosphatase